MTSSSEVTPLVLRVPQSSVEGGSRTEPASEMELEGPSYICLYGEYSREPKLCKVLGAVCRIKHKKKNFTHLFPFVHHRSVR